MSSSFRRAAFAAAVSLFVHSASAADLVINELDYDMSGTDAAEFFEIKNTTASPILLSDYRVRLINGANGGAAQYDLIALPAISLAAGDYFVVCANAATVANCDLDDGPDTNFIQNGAPEAIVIETVSPIVVHDTVSYEGSTPGFTEGTGTTASDSDSLPGSLSRCSDGADTQDNNADFAFRASTPGVANDCPGGDAAPAVDSSSPPSGASNIAIDANITVTFSEAVTVDTDSFTIVCTSGAQAFTVDAANDPTITLDPTSSLPNGESCTVTVVALQVEDDDVTDPPNEMAADHAFTFTTITAGDQAPVVASTSPADDALNVAVGTNVSVTFSEDVAVTDGWIAITCTNSGTHDVGTTSGGPLTHVFDPAADFQQSENCTVTIDGDFVDDADLEDPPAGLAADFVFDFATSEPFTAIHAIQGSGTASPMAGNVVTTEGVVTARVGNGYFIQSPDAEIDVDPLTSQGLFVFTSSTPPVDAAIGSRVRVAGTVAEFTPSADPASRSNTQLTFATTTQLDVGPLTLPAATSLGGANAPTAAGGLDQLERFEGMRVTVPQFLVTSPSGSSDYTGSSSSALFYGVVSGTDRPFREPGVDVHQTLPAGSPANVPRWDFNPELIRVRNLQQPLAPNLAVRAGTTLAGLTGVLDYGFRRYTLLPDPSPPPTIGQQPAGEAVTMPTTGEISVGAYNIACGTGNSCPTDRAKISIGVRDFMRTPDLLGLVEVTSPSVLQSFVDRINADAGTASPQYVGEMVSTATQSLAIVYKTAEIAPAAPRVEKVAIEQIGAGELLACPDGTPTTDVLNDRPPLVFESVVNFAGGVEYPLTVIVNHPKSLIDVDSEDVYPPGDPFACFGTVGARNREKRQQQSEFLANFLDARQAARPDERVVLVGDFNAFQFNDGYVDVIGTLTGVPTPDDQTVQPGDGTDLVEPSLFDIVDTAPPASRYSFLFAGNPQVLDHVIVNDQVIADTADVRVEFAHINADYISADRSVTTTALRASDHDPVVAFLATTTPPTISAIADASGPEDTALVVDFTIGDSDGTVACGSDTVAGHVTASVEPAGNEILEVPNIGFLGGSGTTCQASLTPFTNAVGSVTVTLTVTDEGGATASESFLATFTNVNDSPSIQNLPDTAATNEDTASAVLDFAIGDVETGSESLVVTATSSDQSIVADAGIVVSGSTASRTIQVTPVANASGGPVTITVTVDDTSGEANSTVSDTIAFTVNAVNDVPTVSDVTGQATNEDTATGAIPFTVGDVETAAADLVVTGASSNDAVVADGSVVIGGSGANRTVTITPVAGASGTTTITLSASDGTDTGSDTFELSVGAVNDDPTISNVGDQATNEDTATGAIAFTVGDGETAAADLVVTASSSNQSVVADASIAIGGAGADRTVTITPVANASGPVTITLTVTDGDAATASDTFVLNVTAVNDAPMLSALADLTIDEDGTTGALPFTVTDVDHPALDCDDVTVTSDNDLVVPEANITIGGSGSSCTITAVPVANATGATLIEVSVADGAGGFASEAFTLTVDSGPEGNDAPTITGPADQTIPQGGTTGALAVTIGDIETAAADLALTATSSNTNLVPDANVVLGGSGASRTVTVTGAAGLSGTTTITLSVSDGQGGSAVATFDVTVQGDLLFANGFEN